MTQTLTIKDWTIDLNTYILAERRNRYLGAELKKVWTEIVMREAQKAKLVRMVSPVNVSFGWHVNNKRKDKDNIAFGKKFILDGLVLAGILDNDGWDNIGVISDAFIYNKFFLEPFVDIYLLSDTE